MFVERKIFTVLEDGLQPYLNDPKKLETWLIENEFSQDEAHRAREVFEAHPPTVAMGYARPGKEFPQWCIVLGTEQTASDYIGEGGADNEPFDMEDDEEGERYLDEDGNPEEIHVRRWADRFDIYVYADHPDTTLVNYYLMREIMVRARDLWIEIGLEDLRYSGAELAPDPRYLPSNLFVRRFSIDCNLHLEDPKTVQRGTQVSAMQDDQNQSDYGTEKPGITTYVP